MSTTPIVTTWRPRVLSYSAVDLYRRCPAAYRRRYVDRVPELPSPRMAFGAVMARALEAEHRGQDGDLVFVQEYARQLTTAGLRGAPSLQHGLALLAAYRQRGVPAGEPECKFLVPLPDRQAVPVDVLGFMDLATPEGVYEFKTAAGGWDQGRADTSLQAALYRYAYLRTFGRKPQWVKFVVFSTRGVVIEEYTTYPAGPELRLFEQWAAQAWRGIVAGAFDPQCRACAACAAHGLTKAAADGPTWDFE